MDKTKRSLSGVFFRHQNETTKKWENWCFEDLPKEEQERIVYSYSTDQLIQLIRILANTLNEVGEEANVTKEHNDSFEFP